MINRCNEKPPVMIKKFAWFYSYHPNMSFKSFFSPVLSHDKPLESISFFDSGKLRTISCPNISLRKFSADLPNLESLDLKNNKLSSLTNIYLPRLVKLELDSNLFAQLRIGPLPHLHSLSISDNRLISISRISQHFPRQRSQNMTEIFSGRVSISAQKRV